MCITCIWPGNNHRLRCRCHIQHMGPGNGCDFYLKHRLTRNVGSKYLVILFQISNIFQLQFNLTQLNSDDQIPCTEVTYCQPWQKLDPLWWMKYTHWTFFAQWKHVLILQNVFAWWQNHCDVSWCMLIMSHDGQFFGHSKIASFSTHKRFVCCIF